MLDDLELDGASLEIDMPYDPALPENFDRQKIEQRQLDRLRQLLTLLLASNPFWQQKWRKAGVNFSALSSMESLADLSQLPLTTKAELVEDQTASPPYGTNLTWGAAAGTRMHQTSGTTGQPIRWLDTADSWQAVLGCWEQLFRIVGIRTGDRFAFPFSFGPFLGFWAGFEGAGRLGHFCVAGGGLSSEARLRLIADNQATIVCCTPTYALRLLDVARAGQFPLPDLPVRMILVAGEPGGALPTLRQTLESGWNARVIDHWGMTELGPLGMECAEQPGGMHLLETEAIAEILDPKTHTPVEPGEIGELVITNLYRSGSPLIRYRTGDLVRQSLKPCACGRELLRLEGGILGRLDDMLTIRGNNVFPSSLEAILREFPEICEFRVEVRTHRAMSELRIEIEPDPATEATDRAATLCTRVAERIRDRLHFQAQTVLVPAGSLPRFEMKARRWTRIED